MNYKDFTLEDWIAHISGVIEDESELDGNEMRDLVEFLSRLPKWIPVSERLPDNTGWYFITFKTADGVAVCELSYRKPENYWTDKDISKKVLDNNDVLAWMPLPEPYKAESEEETWRTLN